MKKGFCYFACFFFFFSFFSPVFADQISSTLTVGTQVTANCSLSASPLSFGNYDPIKANVSAPLDAVTSFRIACTKGANVSITLNNGLNNGNAAGTTRAMTDGAGHFLSYELYSDAGRGSIWSQSHPTSYVPVISTPVSKTIYGRIPGGQNPMGGNYLDTVTITATF